MICIALIARCCFEGVDVLLIMRMMDKQELNYRGAYGEQLWNLPVASWQVGLYNTTLDTERIGWHVRQHQQGPWLCNNLQHPCTQ